MSVERWDPDREADDEVARLCRRAAVTSAPTLLTSSAGDVQVGMAAYRWVGDAETTHPGWWLTLVHVAATHHGQGHGHALVAAVCRLHLEEHDGHPLYLARRPVGGRPFAGGFGFKPLRRGRYRNTRGLRVYVADPPDPDWTRDAEHR